MFALFAPMRQAFRLGSFMTQAMPLALVTPDGAVLLVTAGLVLIAWELNRPGSILPGALGLLCVLLGAATVTRWPLQPWSVLLLLLSISLLFANLWLRIPLLVLLAASLSFAFSLRFLVAPAAPRSVHLPVAVSCGLLLGGAGSFLARIALRARRAKKVN